MQKQQDISFKEIKMKKRIVITGIGLFTALGHTVEETWANVRAGKVGIDKITKFDDPNIRAKVAAEIKNYDPEDHFTKRDARRMDALTQYGVIAAREAYNMAELEQSQFDSNRFDIILSTGIGGLNTLQDTQTTGLQKGFNRISPYFIPMSIGNMPAASVAMEMDLHGQAFAPITACAGGTDAIGIAYRNILHGYSDLAIAGGAESTINQLGVGGFAALRALSTSEDPKRASIPFDQERDGFVTGEGSGVLVLESLEHAKARGANIIAEIVGYQSTCDGYHMTAPDPEGTQAKRAMRECLEFSGKKPEDVDYINAHGTSTPLNDKIETEVIKDVLGDHAYDIKISSTKSMLGHGLGASGGIEAAMTVLTIRDQFIHPTAGLQKPDPECDLDYVPNEGIASQVKLALSNSLGFGGHNATVAFAQYQE